MDAAAITGTVTTTGFTANTWNVDTVTTGTTGYFATGQCAGSRQNCVLLKQPSSATTTASTPAQTVPLGSSSSIFIKNPTSAQSFYVRIQTFSDLAYTTTVDDGAVAGSVNTGIDITSKVQETLNFSTSATTVAPTSSCTALSGSGALALGDANGVLNVGTTSSKNSYFRLSTNANSGTDIQYAGDTLKTPGGLTIAQIGSTATAASTSAEQFGMTLDSTDTQAGDGYSLSNLVRTSPYNADTTYAYNSSSLTTPIKIAGAVSGNAVACETGSVKYIANVLPSTKPGIYKTQVTYFAVPTF
jgi:hypothetical protein